MGWVIRERDLRTLTLIEEERGSFCQKSVACEQTAVRSPGDRHTHTLGAVKPLGNHWREVRGGEEGGSHVTPREPL